MKSRYLIAALAFSLLLPTNLAQARSDSGAEDGKFNVEIEESIEKFEIGYSRSPKKRGTDLVENTGEDKSRAVQVVYFELNSDPNSRRSMPEVGKAPAKGGLCLNADGQVGVFRDVPLPATGEAEETHGGYVLGPGARTGGYRACAPFDPADLEAANLEAVEEDGTLVLRPIRVVLTVQDLASFPITPASIHQQNPPHTLKNYHTNFWADPNPQEFTTTIAGRVVQVRATPVLYTFDYGDGTSKTTTNPGYRLGDDIWDEETPTSHQYKEAKDFTFTLTTTYRGEYSVEGGPWQVIDGTVEQTGEGQLVRVWQTKVGLVAGDR